MFVEFDTPWKVFNRFTSWLIYPLVRLNFAYNHIPWGKGWHFHGAPIIQKHRKSSISIGDGLDLRSAIRANPLGANRPIIISTWEAGAIIEIGNNFAMTGGTICATNKILIGNNVTVGANTIIVDTDFHTLDPELRRHSAGLIKTAPVSIYDDVFIGMCCLILKGVTIGHQSVVGAGSVVAKNVPSGVIVAGNPARVIGKL